MKQLIILILIASLMNGCMVKHIFNGDSKGHGGGHQSPATMRQ